MEINPREEENQNSELAESELKITPIISQSLFYDFYKVKFAEATYVAKVFPSAKVQQYEREKQVLIQLNHSNIIKPISFQPAMMAKLTNTLRSQLILFPEAARGSIFQYVQTNGRLSERVVRYYIGQIIDALSYAHSKGFIHPHLLAENILLDQNRRILLCGWSNSLGNQYYKLQDLFFAVGELIISLCTSRRPFISKDSKSDPFAKFLSDNLIHKFWEQIEKICKKMYKDFQFSNEIKSLVSALFLGKAESFQKISQSSWLKQAVNEQQLFLELAEQQSKALSLKQMRKARALKTQNEEKEIVRSNFTMHLNRKPSRSYDIFQEEYSNFETIPIFIHQKSKEDCQLYFRFFDEDPRLVISHLRATLRKAERDQQNIVDPLLLLKDFEVSFEKGVIKLNCTFGWNYSQLQQNVSLCGYSYLVDIVLRREQSALLGRLEMSEPNELNGQCIFLMNQWLIETLQQHG